MIILAHCSNGYVGCDAEDTFWFPNDATDSEIEKEIWEWACDNANSYSYVHFGWDVEITDDEWDEYIQEHVTYDYRKIDYDTYVEWCENWGYIPDTKEDME